MITSFETGAVFTIVDRFSTPLDNLLRKLGDVDTVFKKVIDTTSLFGTKFDASVKSAMSSLTLFNDDAVRKAAGIDKAFDGAFVNFGRSAALAADSVIASMARVDASVRSSQALISSSVAGSALGGNAAVLRPGSHGANGPHFSRVSVPTGMGHMSFGGSGALAAAGLVGYAAYEEAEVEDVIKRAAMTGQLPLAGNVTDSAQGKALRDIIMKGAVTTGFSVKDVGNSILGTERQFGGLSFDKRLEVLNQLLPHAGFEAHMKDTGLGESFEAMVGLMHMSGEFDPKNLPHLARSFEFASMITPSTLPQFGNALSYSMPKLHAGMEMDPAVIMLMTAGMQTAGVRSTKSGTWLKNFFERAEPDTEIVGDLSKSQVAHNEALRQLGMLDSDGKASWIEKGSDGQVDWMKSVLDLSTNLGTRLKGYSVDDRLELMKKAFGEQGSGFAGLLTLPQFTEQLPILAGKMQAFKGGEGALQEYSSGSTVQQAREVWRDTQNILLDLGKTVLPAVNKALTEFDSLLKVENPLAKLSTDLRNFISGGLPQLFDNGMRPGGLPMTPAEKNHFMQGGLYHPSAFGGLAGSDGMTGAVRDGFLQAFSAMQGGLPGGSGGGASGIINAAYTTFGSGSSGPGVGHFFSAADREANIRKTAVALGINPNVAMAVARSEGFGKFSGDRNTSFGDLQMHVGGGLGDLYRRITGKNPSDPHNELDLDRFALQQASRGGWAPWHGAARIGVHGMDGIGRVPSVTAPSLRPPAASADHIHIHLDGKEIQASVTRRQSARGRFPTSVGSLDAHGSFASPGTPMIDAA